MRLGNVDMEHEKVESNQQGLDALVQTDVCSWNEWDQLRHVIVGRADGSQIPAPEPAINAKIPEGSLMRTISGHRTEDSIVRANRQLDAFVEILEQRGIRVDRPQPIDFAQPACTPDFEAPTQFGCMPPRDVLLTVGRVIVEATMSYRCRWFEYLAYRPLLEAYFEADNQFHHVAAPKPRLTDRSYRAGYFADTIDIETRLEWTAASHYVTTEEEILFDAADVARIGRDLFVQHGFTTNLKGIDWLRRQFPDHRVHKVSFSGDPYPIHIDCSFVPLRPGLVLVNPERRMDISTRAFLERNNWEIIDAARPAHDEPPPLCYSSIWLSMNVLMLDHNTVCIEASEVYQADQLDRLGFEVVLVPFRDAYPFGGGLHCATADVRRDGHFSDLFPHG